MGEVVSDSVAAKVRYIDSEWREQTVQFLEQSTRVNHHPVAQDAAHAVVEDPGRHQVQGEVTAEATFCSDSVVADFCRS